MLAAILLSSLASASAVRADDGPTAARSRPDDGGDQGAYVVQFHEIEVVAFAELVSRITGEAILVDGKVRQKISVFAPAPVPASAMLSLFEEALAAGGQYALVRGELGHRVVLRRDAARSEAPVHVYGAWPDPDRDEPDRHDARSR